MKNISLAALFVGVTAILFYGCSSGSQGSTFSTSAAGGGSQAGNGGSSGARSSGASGYAGSGAYAGGAAAAGYAGTGGAAGTTVSGTGGIGGLGYGWPPTPTPLPAGGGAAGCNEFGVCAEAAPPPDAPACAGESRSSKPVVADIIIMLDKSISMACPTNQDACTNATTPPAPPPTRWTAFTDAIKAFAADPGSAGIGVGLDIFPGLNTAFCGPYNVPLVPIAPLPGVAASILNIMAMNGPGSTTPTEPALQGAIDYAKAYDANGTGHVANVVFVTDGIPNGCNSTVAGAAAIAAAGFAGTPSVKTYVIGLGDTAALDQIALAGTGNATHYFPATGDVVTPLLAALKAITTVTISCDYMIPTNGQTLDYRLVNVETTVGPNGTPTMVDNVINSAQCGPSGGWYYDVNPPVTPTKIGLCPQSCGPLASTAGSSLRVIIGCATELIIH
jgi:hypothetical protein